MIEVPLIILGGGGVAREVHDIVVAINERAQHNNEKVINFLGFVASDVSKPELLLERGKILGGDEVLESLPRGTRYVVAIGNGIIRSNVSEKANDHGHIAYSLIHPLANIGSFSNHIGNGSIIGSGVSITTNVSIGNHVFVDRNSTIGHDVVIDDFVSIYPQVSISGNVTLGLLSTIGTGARIIQGISVGESSFVGAGAVVTADVTDSTTVVGVPAKNIAK